MKMNCDNWTEDDEADVHTYANLIKIWYRELPAPVLQELVQCEKMIQCESEEDCRAAFDSISQPAASLLVFLVDILTQVALCEEHNKMSAKNCAIVAGPNLLRADMVETNPMKALVLSQKTANFVEHLINFQLRVVHNFVRPESAKNAPRKHT
jgi:hypothetical protein